MSDCEFKNCKGLYNNYACLKLPLQIRSHKVSTFFYFFQPSPVYIFIYSLSVRVFVCLITTRS